MFGLKVTTCRNVMILYILYTNANTLLFSFIFIHNHIVLNVPYTVVLYVVYNSSVQYVC